MGASVCKSVKVKSISTAHESCSRDGAELVGVTREPVEHVYVEHGLTTDARGARKTDENFQRTAPTPTPRSPVEHEDTTDIHSSSRESIKWDKPSTVKSTPSPDRAKNDDVKSQSRGDDEDRLSLSTVASLRYGDTTSIETEGQRAPDVEPVEETPQQIENSAISRENEAIQEKGDSETSALCINQGGSATLPPTDQQEDMDHISPPSRETTGDTYNIHIADREIRLKGVISKCCQSYTKDDVMFVEVPAYEAARDHLLKYSMLTLTSKPGEGKTLLARHLLLDIIKSEHPDVRLDEVILADTPDDWKDHINPNKRQFVLIEDIFGVSNLSKNRLDMWRPLLDTIARVVIEQSGKLCVVVTSRRHILEEAKELIKDCPFLDEQGIINLTDFPLNSEVKRKILLKHVNDLSEKEIQEIVRCDIPHGFPYCCKIFSSNTHLRKKGSAFFKNPVGYIKEEVESLRRTDVVKYCALVLCMLNDGHINKSELDITQLDEAGKTRLRDILQLTEVPSEISTTSLIDALDNLTCLYLVNYNDTYRFMHPCLLEVVTEMCSKFIPGAIVKHCSPNFLHERVRIRTKQARSGGSFVVLLEKEQFKFLASRFYEEVKAKRIKSVVQHEACRDDNFVNFFKGFLEKNNLSTDIVIHYDSSLRSILYWCAWTGSFKLFAYILHGFKSDGVSTEYLNTQKSMCLVAASFFGFKDIVDSLLNSITGVKFNDQIHDKRTNSKYKVFGFVLGRLMSIAPTPLHAAVCGGFKDIVEKLLYYLADVNAKTEDGSTPLHIAVCAGHVDIVDILLRNNPPADVNAADVYRRTPLRIASGIPGIYDTIPKEFAMERMPCVRVRDPQNQLRIAKALMENGSSVNSQDWHLDTPLHSALASNNFRLAEMLVSSDYDVDLKNMIGDTCLHLAAKFGQTDICKLLIDRRANVNAVNMTNKTMPLHMAVHSGNADTVKYLVEIGGAHTEFRNNDNETPLDIAERCGFREAIELLNGETDIVTSL
ncbi:uncharacterized protein LOC117343023 isoform X1 [Pecten maximus]|uniref:uncharacterized protein LOC117343023 isoform X1 n=1 Tax=Pecten maximus TaxID=6579 RepID=UPI001458E1A8|nr:uncharacterized protein LOC117343023 isoform X1 [Pecten maximus]